MRTCTSARLRRLAGRFLGARNGDAVAHQRHAAQVDGDAVGVEVDAADAQRGHHAAPVRVGAVQRATHQLVLGHVARGAVGIGLRAGADDLVAGDPAGALAVGHDLDRQVVADARAAPR